MKLCLLASIMMELKLLTIRINIFIYFNSSFLKIYNYLKFQEIHIS